MNSFFTGLITSITDNPLFSSFDFFGSNEYLQEYYSSIDQENDELLKFYAQGYRDLAPVKSTLEFSGGPTVYSLISTSNKTEYIHFSDYLKNNRDEVSRWRNSHPRAFNWDNYIAKALEYEGVLVNDAVIAQRRELIKQKITKIVPCNAFETFSLAENQHNQYDIVQSNFVADSITSSMQEWQSAISNITAAVKKGGYLFLTSLKHAEYYLIEDKKFPAVPIAEKDILDVLRKNGFNIETILLKSIIAYPYRGYAGMIFIRAQKAA